MSDSQLGFTAFCMHQIASESIIMPIESGSKGIHFAGIYLQLNIDWPGKVNTRVTAISRNLENFGCQEIQGYREFRISQGSRDSQEFRLSRNSGLLRFSDIEKFINIENFEYWEIQEYQKFCIPQESRNPKI